jgi:DNA-binding transcriptional LysR family regulator
VDVDLRQIRYFITLAEELHFSQAAKRLHLDQPTLSRHVRRLEEKLGVKLFNRTTRTVTLTAAGEAFLGKAREVIGAADSAVNAAREAAAGRTGVLRVGMMVQVAEPLRSAAFNLFEKRYPDVELKPKSYPFIDPACGLESDETDVALVWLPILHPEIETEQLFEEPRYFIVANDHRLARRRSIRREDVEDERFFSWPESWGLSPTAMAWGTSSSSSQSSTAHVACGAPKHATRTSGSTRSSEGSPSAPRRPQPRRTTRGPGSHSSPRAGSSLPSSRSRGGGTRTTPS